MKRKSLAETLSPEVRQFIEAGTPKPEAAEDPAPEPAPEVNQPPPVARPRPEEGTPEPGAPLVTQSYRLPQPLVHALVRVSMERKLARQKPWSQQDIVAEALAEWLRRHKNN